MRDVVREAWCVRRKRLVIGLVAIAVTGVGVMAYAVAAGTVEYHRRAYYQAEERRNLQDWRSRLANRVSYRTGITPRFLYPSKQEKERLGKEMVSHLVALERLAAAREAASREDAK